MDVNIMGFYEQISKYYDYIFPVGQDQLNLIMNSTGVPPKRILDIACGTGSYSIELAKKGYRVTGIDLDMEMVNRAKMKAEREGLEIDFRQLDMKDVKKVSPGKFDCIFSIGNSIVHLESADEILDVLRQMKWLLVEGGVLILQTVNYDRVLKYDVDELPTIKNNRIGLEFIRKYEFNRSNGKINFNTTLVIDNANEKASFKNSIELFPLKSSDVVKLLNKAGFSKLELYGDFKQTQFSEKSFATVIKAIK